MSHKKSTKKLITATLERQKNGHAYITIDYKGQPTNVVISKDLLFGAVKGDTVQVKISASAARDNYLSGEIVNIVKRNQQLLIGRLVKYKNDLFFNCLLAGFPEKLKVLPSKLQLQPANVVSVKINKQDKMNQLPRVEVVEVIAALDSAEMEIEIALRKFALPHTFSARCLAQTKQLPSSVQAKEFSGRRDLTTLPLVTIDGEDAKDFDDAVYAEPSKIKGRLVYRLVVAIADVSHYVTTNNPIDLDAIDRATSVYFPRRVIPMLPEKLSNGLCSLKPLVNRLAMVADMHISAKTGEILNYQFYPAVIFSHARLTYTQVAEVIQHPRKKPPADLVALKPHLLNLHKLFKVLYANRQQRGALDFDSIETEMHFDVNNQISAIVPRIRNDAHKLIEEAMLAANVCAADFILAAKQPGVFRIHDIPRADKIEGLKLYLDSLGVKYKLSAQPQPRELQKIADAVRERPDCQQIHTTMLRCLAKAVYSPINIGHYGLAYQAYSHFTSPIRRYPDLMVHRIIKAILNKKPLQLSVPDIIDIDRITQQLAKENASKPALVSKKHPPKNKPDAWQIITTHCSMNERRADEASLDVQAWLKCQFMQAFIGQEFTATISSVTNFGLFVSLDKYFVDGLVHITDLGEDYFVYDQNKQLLRGERGGTKFTLGQALTVKLIRVNSDSRQIDFVLPTLALQTKLPRENSTKQFRRSPKIKLTAKSSDTQTLNTPATNFNSEHHNKPKVKVKTNNRPRPHTKTTPNNKQKRK